MELYTTGSGGVCASVFRPVRGVWNRPEETHWHVSYPDRIRDYNIDLVEVQRSMLQSVDAWLWGVHLDAYFSHYHDDYYEESVNEVQWLLGQGEVVVALIENDEMRLSSIKSAVSHKIGPLSLLPVIDIEEWKYFDEDGNLRPKGLRKLRKEISLCLEDVYGELLL